MKPPRQLFYVGVFLYYVVMNAVSDYYAFIKSLSFSKMYNYCLLAMSYLISIVTRRTILLGYPASLSVEPTTNCNLKCPECPSGLRQFSRKTGNMNIETYKNIISQSYKHLMYLSLYFQGEPFLHPVFFEFIKFAKQKNIYTATSTNGHFLHAKNVAKLINSGLDRLIISLDGASSDSYQKYRIGGNFETVVNGLKTLIEERKRLGAKTPYIILQMVVFSSNEYEINAIKRLGKNLGVDKVQIKTAQFYHLSADNPLIPKEKKYLRYKKTGNSYHISGKIPNRCWRSWQGAVFTTEGDIVPCCFDKDAHHVFGNIQVKNLQSIVHGSSRKEFLKNIQYNRRRIDICRNCSEGISVYK